MGEVIEVDRGLGAGVAGCDVHGTARKWMAEDGACAEEIPGRDDWCLSWGDRERKAFFEQDEESSCVIGVFQ